MAVYIKYFPKKYNRKDFKKNIEEIKNSGFEGVLLPASRPEDQTEYKTELFPISRMIEIAKENGLKTGVILKCFHSAKTWDNLLFSPPVGISGVSMTAKSWYHPLCPNNPVSLNRYSNLLNKMVKISKPDLFYLEHLRFPFLWQKEDLDIQSQAPPFCYCPFCVTEYATIIGDIVSHSSQILETMPEWLSWRTSIILERYYQAKKTLAPIAKIIVAVPPLSLIDLPFTTGQLPLAFSEEGSHVSPLIYNNKMNKNYLWTEDLMNQYDFDMPRSRISPAFDIGNNEEFQINRKLNKKYDDIFFYNWNDYKKFIRL